ncbi:hypothetical protein MKX03_002790, partial [Papaver bracteatum]
ECPCLIERALNRSHQRNLVVYMMLCQGTVLWVSGHAHKDLDYLARQEWLVKIINKKAEKSVLSDGVNHAKTSRTYVKVNYPDTSRMIVYDSRQKQDAALLHNTT